MLTIVTPATDRKLLTAAEMRAAAGTTPSDTELAALNAYVSAIITAACQVPRESVGNTPATLREETVSESFEWGTYQSFASLSRRPVISFTSVTENGSALTASDWQLEGHLLYRVTGDARTWWPSGDLAVVYVAGWSTVPDDLKYLAIKMVKQELAMGGATSSGGNSDANLKRLKIEGVSEREWYVSSGSTSDTGGLVPPDIQMGLELGGYVQRWGHMR